MKLNMGPADKAIRLIVAAAISLAWALGYLPGILGIVLLVLAGIFLFTSIVGVCPLYMPFGFSTKR